MMRDVYDVAIIGMGAVGTATGFLLTEFTNVQSVLFLEKENSAGQIASDRRTNSQTRHPFGGELNYTPEVMKAIKRYSDMIPSYTNSKYGRGYDIVRRTKSGMVLAVGNNEKDYLRKKFHDTVKPVFPYAELVEDKEEIAKLEPYIVRGRKKDEAKSEEHTSELQSLTNLVCRLLLEKKNIKSRTATITSSLRCDGSTSRSSAII